MACYASVIDSIFVFLSQVLQLGLPASFIRLRIKALDFCKVVFSNSDNAA